MVEGRQVGVPWDVFCQTSSIQLQPPGVACACLATEAFRRDVKRCSKYLLGRAPALCQPRPWKRQCRAGLRIDRNSSALRQHVDCHIAIHGLYDLGASMSPSRLRDAKVERFAPQAGGRQCPLANQTRPKARGAADVEAEETTSGGIWVMAAVKFWTNTFQAMT